MSFFYVVLQWLCKKERKKAFRILLTTHYVDCKDCLHSSDRFAFEIQMESNSKNSAQVHLIICSAFKFTQILLCRTCQCWRPINNWSSFPQITQYLINLPLCWSPLLNYSAFATPTFPPSMEQNSYKLYKTLNQSICLLKCLAELLTCLKVHLCGITITNTTCYVESHCFLPWEFTQNRTHSLIPLNTHTVLQY